jgi:hypothetical protein
LVPLAIEGRYDPMGWLPKWTGVGGLFEFRTDSIPGNCVLECPTAASDSSAKPECGVPDEHDLEKYVEKLKKGDRKLASLEESSEDYVVCKKVRESQYNLRNKRCYWGEKGSSAAIMTSGEIA